MGTGASASLDAAAGAASTEALQEALQGVSAENLERIAAAVAAQKAKSLAEHREVKTLTFQEHGDETLPREYSPQDIARAWYGAPGNEWSEDGGTIVTDRVKALVQGGETACASNDLFGDPAPGVVKVLVVEVSQPGDGHREVSNDIETAAVTVEEVVLVGFMDGDTLSIPLSGGELVRDVKGKVAAQKKKRDPNTMLKLVCDNRVLRDSEAAGPLAGFRLQGVWSKSETSYIVMDDGEAVVVDEGDAKWDAQIAKKSQVDPAEWVPAPESRSDLQNLAKLSLGVKVEASSAMFGSQQNLLNVLRLGSKHGDPRFMGGDNSFIFRENQAGQTMWLDFGRPVTLFRIGSMCYGDRWVDYFAVATSMDEDPHAAEWVRWGESRAKKRNGGVVYLDTDEEKGQRARLVRMECSSGHYWGAGARLGPVFAWGM